MRPRALRLNRRRLVPQVHAFALGPEPLGTGLQEALELRLAPPRAARHVLERARDVERPEVIESTALGAAYLASIQIGLWKKSDIMSNRKIQKCFKPRMSSSVREKLYRGWQKAVKRTMGWGKEE